MRYCNKRGAFLAALLSLAGVFILTGPNAFAAMVNLTADGTASGTIGDVIFSRDNFKPTGTGVFDPFLTVQSPGKRLIEQGYNTSAQDLPLNDLRNHWNKNLQVQDLATTMRDGNSYYVFQLDANEPGQGTVDKYLSIDNIRIYTSGTGSQNPQDPDVLGTLRYAMNNTVIGMENWVEIDASRNDVTGQVTSGSGSADMFVYIPTAYLAGAAATDFVYFYNRNGAHFGSKGGLSADAGFEEWRAFVTPVPEPTTWLAGALLLVPFGASTFRLLRKHKAA